MRRGAGAGWALVTCAAMLAACQAPATDAGAAPPTATDAVAPPPLPVVALPPAIARVLEDYEAAWRARDAAALAALFVEDGFVLSSGRPPVRGRADIRARYADSGGPLELHAFAFGARDDLAYVIGGFRRRPSEPDLGKFTLVLRRGVDGRWRIVSDMDNGNSWPS